MTSGRKMTLRQPPRRQMLAWLAAGAALPLLQGCERGVGSGPTSRFKGLDITGAQYGRGFSLVDHDGRRRTLADFRGRVVLMYFGFAQCPDVCPTALTRAAEVKRLLGDQSNRFQVLFVTVDPERDTPAMLREYMAAFDPGFLALTGSMTEIKAAADEFRVYYKKVPTGSSYTMDHGAMSYLFDPQGRLRVILRHSQTADDYAADVRSLLTEPVT